MKGKILPFLSILFLIAVVGVMSWRDMHPEAGGGKPEKLSSFTYHADTGVTPAMIPDDNNPVTIALGTFRHAPDGKTEWIPQGMPPAILAQRQVNLLFRFDGLPKNPAETLEKMQFLVKDWERQGNTAATLFLDYRPKTPDFRSYAEFLDAAHDRFRLTNSLGIVTDISWTDIQERDPFEQLHKNIVLFQIDLPQPKIAPELFLKLKRLRYAFLIRFPAGVLPADLDMRDYKKLMTLSGIVLTLDPHNPWPQKEERIGIFPKL
ncbi:MAG: hypothetical protein V1721_06700 [Pseudomonadota bacterium]